MTEQNAAYTSRNADAGEDVLTTYYRRYLEGDEDALAAIIRSTIDFLLQFTGSLVRDAAAAEEIVDDAYVQIAVKKHAFRGDSHLKTYLCAVCRNRAVDHLRRCTNRREDLLDDWLTDPETETVEARFLRTERDEWLHNAIEKLPDDYRTALLLVYFEGLSHPEVAQVMRRTRRQTENLIFRARASLRAALEKEGYSYEDL